MPRTVLGACAVRRGEWNAARPWTVQEATVQEAARCVTWRPTVTEPARARTASDQARIPFEVQKAQARMRARVRRKPSPAAQSRRAERAAARGLRTVQRRAERR